MDIGGGDLYRMADEGWDALMDANDEHEPRVMVRGNELVRMTERGELEAFNVHSLRDELSRVAEFGKSVQGDWSPTKPPREIADLLLNRDSAEYRDAPRVERVVDVPVVNADESFLTEPGYHPGSRLYYRPADGLGGVREDDVELVENVDEARELLLGKEGLLGEFAFAEDADRANAFGLLLLPFVRDLIEGPTPLHVIHAPEPGTGKTLLAQAALLPGCGDVETMPEAGTDEEWRKRLTAVLMAGARAVVLDNIRRTLDSGALASALTTGKWSDRVLGHSKQVTLPVRNAWVATGNNIQLTDEQARRSVPIFLEPGDVRPADRPEGSYTHPNLLSWARDNRARLASAALTLVRHWLEGEAVAVAGGHRFERLAGQRTRNDAKLGSFESWSYVIGGVLRAAGVDGFLANRERLMVEANPERRQASAFLAAWAELDGPARDLGDVTRLCLMGSGPLYPVLPDKLVEFAGHEERLKQKLSYWLRSHKGHRFDGHQLIGQDTGRITLWSARRTDAPSVQDGAA